ncbi:hypothetical protein DES53_109262 [Roseimicrobium gellanilyticum]|uniref:Uncharacterized protein n=1 Tax=Roseimicrobium gellanilyticum TaxID=748857 RepID=A0A366HDY9_9BACT|nr:ABC transporter permease [Roseimicrobium gellanilyticum]RBP39834.1 hypothetical protein DES53_109262 [Roseimicrobium gellanilyticum]
MNMVATLPEPESASQLSIARQQVAHPQGLWLRVRHQCVHELRRQWLLVLLMWLLPVTSLALQISGLEYHLILGYIIGPVSVVFCVVLTCRCVWASSAARPEILIHTQPLGRLALVLSQGLFMLVAIVVPWLLLDIVAGLGFEFSRGQWSQLVLGSFLMVLLPIGLSAAWMSAARTYRQQGVIFIVALLAWWGAALLCSEMSSNHLLDWLEPDRSFSTEQYWVHLFGAGLMGFILWVLQSLWHRRRVMLCAALAGAVVLALITLGWPWNWMRGDAMTYTRGTPRLVLPGADKALQPGATRLWDGVVVEGLQPAEVPVITGFHHRGFRFPTSFTDANDRDPAPNTFGTKRAGVNVDMMRTINSSLPQGWIVSDDGRVSVRPPLKDVLQMTASDLSSVQERDAWTMTLAVVQPRMVAEFPLRDVLDGKKEFLLEPGLRGVMGEIKSPEAFLQLWVQTAERSPILSKHPARQGGTTTSERLPRKLYVLLLDDSQNMAHMKVSQSITMNPYAVGFPGMTFTTALMFDTLPVDGPRARMQITGLTREQWISQVRVQIWWPELHGYSRLHVTGAEVQKMSKAQGS